MSWSGRNVRSLAHSDSYRMKVRVGFFWGEPIAGADNRWTLNVQGLGTRHFPLGTKPR